MTAELHQVLTTWEQTVTCVEMTVNKCEQMQTNVNKCEQGLPCNCFEEKGCTVAQGRTQGLNLCPSVLRPAVTKKHLHEHPQRELHEAISGQDTNQHLDLRGGQRPAETGELRPADSI